MNRNQIYTLTGSALAMLSTAWLVDLATHKSKKSSLAGGLLLTGIVGLVTGAVIAYLPEHRAKKKLVRQDVLTRRDVARMNQNVSELLGRGSR